jgi:glycosyltransferase involved in cell wall biosynthesis
LQTLCEQTLNSSYLEVIVVDNNSNDNTQDVALQICSQYNNFRYYYEPNQGLSHARNRGWKEAKGEYVAYVDDECKMPKQWLATAKKIIEKYNPSVFGGPILGYFKDPKPKWFKYFSHEPLANARFLNSNEYILIAGGNVFFKRRLLIKFKGFDPTLGMSGSKIGYGEETFLLKKIISSKKETMYFDPDLFLYHLILAKKWTWPFIIKASFSAGQSMFERRKNNFYVQAGYNPLLKLFGKTSLALFIDLLRGVLNRDKIKYPFIQNYFYENSLKYVRHLGRLYGQFLSVSYCKVKPPSANR